jgi:hypothetical protein
MTAKEEAKALVNMFKIRVTITFSEDSVPCILNAPMIEKSAKECALISIKNTIQALEHHTWQNRNTIEHYKEVKEEINKLQ